MTPTSYVGQSSSATRSDGWEKKTRRALSALMPSASRTSSTEP